MHKNIRDYIQARVEVESASLHIRICLNLERFISIPFIWIYEKCKRNDTIVEEDHHHYLSTHSNPRIIEDDTVSRTRYIPTSMGDAALRRAEQESHNQYEYDILYRSQLDEALRASRVQQNNNATNIININTANMNISTGRPTSASSTAAAIGSPAISTHRQTSELRTTNETSPPQSQPLSTPTDRRIEEGFMLRKKNYFLDQFIIFSIIQTFQDLSNMFRKYSSVIVFS